LRDLIAWEPEVALLEIDATERASGVSLIGDLRRFGVSVVVLGNDVDQNLLEKCVRAGSADVVDVRSPLTDLIAVLARLTDPSLDSEPVPPPVSSPQKTPVGTARLAPFAVLTAREKGVLSELMAGHRAETIARNGWVSISTVRSQIKAILQKLGVNSQLAAVAMAREADWEHEPENAPLPLAIVEGA
jgi:DNA-binding NarL/FixJ family response regulator